MTRRVHHHTRTSSARLWCCCCLCGGVLLHSGDRGCCGRTQNVWARELIKGSFWTCPDRLCTHAHRVAYKSCQAHRHTFLFRMTTSTPSFHLTSSLASSFVVAEAWLQHRTSLQRWKVDLT